MLKRLSVAAGCISLVCAGSGVSANTQLPLTTVTCGFQVTSSIRLANSLFGCPYSGLIVKASNVVIDLNGQVVGGDTQDVSDQEAGVLDNEGHDGLIVKNGVIQGFDFGVYVSAKPFPRGQSTGARVNGVTARANFVYGFYLSGIAHRVNSSTAVGNGDDGIVVSTAGSPAGGRVENSTARSNGSNGIVLEGGEGAAAIGNTVESNTGAGIYVSGTSASVAGNRVRDNRYDGIYVVGDGGRYSENIVTGNAHGFGINESASDATFSKNSVSLNRNSGFVMNAGGSAGHHFVQNVVTQNGFEGFAVHGPNVTFNGDRAVGNGRYGFFANGDGLVFSQVIATGNTHDGIFISAGQSPRVTGSIARTNGFLNGIDDNAGLGIRITATTPVVSNNVASGNDDPKQCTSSAGCA